MMTMFMPAVARNSEIAGLLHICGEVRDHYGIPDQFQPDDHRVHFIRTSNRLRAHGFTLNAEVRNLGEINTALHVFWTRKFSGVNQDLVACGPQIDRFLPSRWHNSPELQRTSIVVQTLQMIPVRYTVRGYHMGVGWPTITPEGKGPKRQNRSLGAKAAEGLYGTEPISHAMSIFCAARDSARPLGFVIADAVFEFGRMHDGNLCWAGQKFTLDSSLYWKGTDYQEAMNRDTLPVAYDRKHLLDHLRVLGVDILDPDEPEDRRWVSQQSIALDALELDARRCHAMFEALTGKNLRAFQREDMGIRF